MRLALLALTLLALAAPAAAQQGRIGEIETGDAALRGTAEPTVPAFYAPAPIVLGAPPSFSATPTAAADAGRCRMACAQDYYFCLAQDDQSDCSPGWRACVLTCGLSSTPAAPGV